jgi:hypothetical protein
MAGGFGDADVHATMLLDPVRTGAYARAIAAVVKPGDVVVDLGSGSGVLALLAARAGARRVYAVERGPMVELLAHAIEDNGARGIVELVHADVRDAEFALPPNVVVSETLGSLGIDEDCLSLAIAVGARCAPGAVFLPSRVEVALALAEDPALEARSSALAALDDLHGLRFGTLRARVARLPVLGRVPADAVASTPVTKGFAIGTDRTPATLSGTCTVTRDAACNALAGWFRTDLAPGIGLSNAPDAPPTCWSRFSLPLDRPLVVRAGERVKLSWKPRVVTNPGTWAWSAARGRDRHGGDALR